LKTFTLFVAALLLGTFAQADDTVDPDSADAAAVEASALAAEAAPAAVNAPAVDASETTATVDDDGLFGLGLDLHAGLNLRTDPGVHPIRLDAGIGWGPFDAVLVLDPMFWTDGQVSTDLLLQWRPAGLAAFAGWRTTAVPLLDGPQWQQNLLLGAGADLPRFFDGHLRGQFGFELAAMMLKHGGGLPDESISFESGRHYIDFLNMAFFLRLETGLGL